MGLVILTVQDILKLKAVLGEVCSVHICRMHSRGLGTGLGGREILDVLTFLPVVVL